MGASLYDRPHVASHVEPRKLDCHLFQTGCYRRHKANCLERFKAQWPLEYTCDKWSQPRLCSWQYPAGHTHACTYDRIKSTTEDSIQQLVMGTMKKDESKYMSWLNSIALEGNLDT